MLEGLACAVQWSSMNLTHLIAGFESDVHQTRTLDIFIFPKSAPDKAPEGCALLISKGYARAL